MAKTTEELCIQKIESGIRSIKNKTKTPKDANCGFFFAKLKPLNEGMYDELMNDYKAVMLEHNKNKDNS